jgi:hypothetical protein
MADLGSTDGDGWWDLLISRASRRRFWERELILHTAWSTKLEAAKLQDTLEVREQHLGLQVWAVREN